MAAGKEQNPFLGAKINVRKNRSKKGGRDGGGYLLLWFKLMCKRLDNSRFTWLKKFVNLLGHQE